PADPGDGEPVQREEPGEHADAGERQRPVGERSQRPGEFSGGGDVGLSGLDSSHRLNRPFSYWVVHLPDQKDFWRTVAQAPQADKASQTLAAAGSPLQVRVLAGRMRPS